MGTYVDSDQLQHITRMLNMTRSYRNEYSSAKYLDPDNDGTNEVIEPLLTEKHNVPHLTDDGNRHYQAILDWVAEGNNHCRTLTNGLYRRRSKRR